ncbi:hypothetical protein HanIR_Chr07g0304181 [Helianthus annuus]|nr:hypothetical protein HanIR_Chr07g0304181 [Helianthus annuus]
MIRTSAFTGGIANPAAVDNAVTNISSSDPISSKLPEGASKGSDTRSRSSGAAVGDSGTVAA